MAAIRGRHTKSTEVRLRMALVRAGLQGWKLHVGALPGKPDMYFLRRRVAVFVDGCFWHGCPSCGHVPKTNGPFWAAKIRRNQERDGKNNRELISEGIEVIRIWEHSLKSRSATTEAVEAIRKSLKTRHVGKRNHATKR